MALRQAMREDRQAWKKFFLKAIEIFPRLRTFTTIQQHMFSGDESWAVPWGWGCPHLIEVDDNLIYMEGYQDLSVGGNPFAAEDKLRERVTLAETTYHRINQVLGEISYKGVEVEVEDRFKGIEVHVALMALEHPMREVPEEVVWLAPKIRQPFNSAIYYMCEPLEPWDDDRVVILGPYCEGRCSRDGTLYGNYDGIKRLFGGEDSEE